MTQPELIYTRIHLPRPLDTTRVQGLLLAIASERKHSPLVFELRADAGRVQHLIGCPMPAVHRVKRLLKDQISGITFSTAPARELMDEVGRVRLRPGSLPLRTDIPEDVTRNLLSAVSVKLGNGEGLVLQTVLHRSHPPANLQPTASSPHTKWWQPLWGTAPDANADERRAMRIRAEDASFATTVRVGASGRDPQRTRRLGVGVQGALSSARSPGVRMDFVREDPRALHAGPHGRGSLELSCAELTGLLGWPLGEDELPGMPPLHPRPQAAKAGVHSGDRVFARSAVPGDDRELEVSAADALLHGVAYGPSGSGKSTAMLHLIEADMKAGRPIAVLDPKRQLIDDCLALTPKSRLDDVVVLDAADQPTVGFNPLDVTGRDPDVVVDGILSVFGGLFTDGWGPRTADIFSGTLRTLARAADRSGHQATLPDIPRILTDRAFRRSVVGHVADDEALASFWAWYEELSPQAQAAAVAAPLNKLRQLLLRPALLRMLDQRETRFSLRNIWRENKILLVPLNEALIGSGTAEMLGSLIVADLWQSVQERASEKSPQARPGFVYVDEAPRFLHLPSSLADSLAVSRSLGVGWFLAAQFARQFPKEMREAIDMNARSKIVWATEYEDARHFARGEKHLKVEDFRSLARFQAYANLVAAGHPQGWALVETLPPSKPSIHPERVVARSRALWGATPAVPAQAAQPPPAGDDGPPAGELRVGRKRKTEGRGREETADE